jgi:hypothetical protein
VYTLGILLQFFFFSFLCSVLNSFYHGWMYHFIKPLSLFLERSSIRVLHFFPTPVLSLSYIFTAPLSPAQGRSPPPHPSSSSSGALHGSPPARHGPVAFLPFLRYPSTSTLFHQENRRSHAPMPTRRVWRSCRPSSTGATWRRSVGTARR